MEAVENWYAPGKVTVSYMTDAELDADKIRRAKEKKKYRFRQDRKAMSAITCHIAENAGDIAKKIFQRRK